MIDHILKRDGVRMELKGYYYLRALIASYNPARTMKAQYKALAEKEGVDPANVERCVRTALVKSTVPPEISVKRYVARAHFELEGEQR